MLSYMLALFRKHTKTALVNVSIWIYFFCVIILHLLLILYIIRANILFKILFASLLHFFDKQSLLASSSLYPFLLRFACFYCLYSCGTTLLGRKTCPGPSASISSGLWES